MNILKLIRDSLPKGTKLVIESDSDERAMTLEAIYPDNRICSQKVTFDLIDNVDPVLVDAVLFNIIKAFGEMREMEGIVVKPKEDTSEGLYYLDLAEEGYWLIRSKIGKRFTAGDDKQSVVDLIKRLNEAHRPNVKQGELHEVFVCWNHHEKGEDCDYVQELPKT